MNFEERLRFNRAILESLGYRMKLSEINKGYYDLAMVYGDSQILNGAECDTECSKRMLKQTA